MPTLTSTWTESGIPLRMTFRLSSPNWKPFSGQTPEVDPAGNRCTHYAQAHCRLAHARDQAGHQPAQKAREYPAVGSRSGGRTRSMQDKYVGDIGDFGKYALLRFLANGDVVLGIVWYRTTAEDKSKDGMLVQYLFSEKEAKSLGNCDAELFNALRRLVESKDRRVVSIRERGIFPGSTVFYEEPLDFALVLPRARPEARTTWCQNSLKKVDQAQLVFLDPDNGLALNERKKYRKTGPKYVFLDELRQYLSQ